MRVLIAVLALLLVGCVREPPPLPEGYKSPPEPTSTYLGPAPANPVAVIGDSYTSGTPKGGRGDKGWPAIAEARLDAEGINTTIDVGAEGGSGYVARGQYGLTFADQVPKVVEPNDKLVVILGSSNDSRDVPPEQLQAAVQSTLADIKTTATQAKLLVVGPFYTRPNPPPALLAVRDIVKAQADAVGATFIDPLAEGWVAERPELISDDGAHPTDEGHRYLADKLTPLIGAQLTDPIQASFIDTFDRPNTELGIGEGWDMRGGTVGEPTLPPATDGYLRDGKYTYRGDGDIVYAVRQFPGAVRAVGARGAWREVGPGPASALALVITPNDAIISDMVHFVANRDEWNLSTRRAGGEFEYVAREKFNPPLTPGTLYTFQIEATDTGVTVTAPGSVTKVKVNTDGLLGDRAFWEEFHKPQGPPSGAVFDYDTVWATVDGQPMQTVPLN